MLTERNTLLSDTCLKFRAIFRKIVMVFFIRNTPNNNEFLDVTNKQLEAINPFDTSVLVCPSRVKV